MKYTVDTDAREVHCSGDASGGEVALAALRHPGFATLVEGENIDDVVGEIPLDPRMEVVHSNYRLPRPEDGPRSDAQSAAP